VYTRRVLYMPFRCQKRKKKERIYYLEFNSKKKNVYKVPLYIDRRNTSRAITYLYVREKISSKVIRPIINKSRCTINLQMSFYIVTVFLYRRCIVGIRVFRMLYTVYKYKILFHGRVKVESRRAYV